MEMSYCTRDAGGEGGGSSCVWSACPAPAGAQGTGALLLNTGVCAPRLVLSITEHVSSTV